MSIIARLKRLFGVRSDEQEKQERVAITLWFTDTENPEEEAAWLMSELDPFTNEYQIWLYIADGDCEQVRSKTHGLLRAKRLLAGRKYRVEG